jgi:S-DNA-T family DNA segregation ATPase FtsK/SpoIIIE
MIVTIKVNQPEAEIHLVDLKEGVDIAPLAVCPGMYAYLNVQATANMLRNVLGDIQRRLALLKTRGMNDIGLFFASDEFKKMSEAERAAHDLGRRLFVVVDECAELMLFSPGKDGAVTRETRGALSKIARLGRAAGVHLILGTQRPDKSAVDPQVKSNLTTIVCFRLNDIGGSLAVLGTGRANDLPKIKGRVILQHGSDEIEVQTPYLDFMAGLAELKPPDTANKKKISPTESLILLSEDSDGKTTPKA